MAAAPPPPAPKIAPISSKVQEKLCEECGTGALEPRRTEPGKFSVTCYDCMYKRYGRKETFLMQQASLLEMYGRREGYEYLDINGEPLS
jgi:hypothetical protein